MILLIGFRWMMGELVFMLVLEFVDVVGWLFRWWVYVVLVGVVCWK